MKISKEKKDRISEQILAHLYSHSPKALFTAHIASELARDEEFIKTLLLDLKAKKLVLQITKNPEGTPYLRRMRWKLTNTAYDQYKRAQ